MIKIEKVKKTFKHVEALKEVDIEINPHERVAIVGPNGAGKTTLIESMIGLTSIDSGKISFDFKYKDSPLEKIGVQFQDATYPLGLTVQDIIDFFIDVAIEKISKEELAETIKVFQMDDFLINPASSLSGGQKQKLNVLLSIISHPEILILDELTTGLDIKVSQAIEKFIFEYVTKRKTTLILVSHYPHEIEMLCDRIIVMNHGEVIYNKKISDAKKEFGSVNSLMQKYI